MFSVSIRIKAQEEKGKNNKTTPPKHTHKTQTKNPPQILPRPQVYLGFVTRSLYSRKVCIRLEHGSRLTEPCNMPFFTSTKKECHYKEVNPHIMDRKTMLKKTNQPRNNNNKNKSNIYLI